MLLRNIHGLWNSTGVFNKSFDSDNPTSVMVQLWLIKISSFSHWSYFEPHLLLISQWNSLHGACDGNMNQIYRQRRRYEYARPRADHDRAGPKYRYLDWYANANILGRHGGDYGTKDIQVLYYVI